MPRSICVCRMPLFILYVASGGASVRRFAQSDVSLPRHAVDMLLMHATCAYKRQTACCYAYYATLMLMLLPYAAAPPYLDYAYALHDIEGACARELMVMPLFFSRYTPCHAERDGVAADTLQRVAYTRCCASCVDAAFQPVPCSSATRF